MANNVGKTIFGWPGPPLVKGFGVRVLVMLIRDHGGHCFRRIEFQSQHLGVCVCCDISAPLDLPQPVSARLRSADKLGDGAGNGFGLLQRQKVSRTRQVDNPDALAELLAERVAIARRSHFIIEALDHEKGSCSGAPPIVERHTLAGRDAGDSQRAPSTVTQSLPLILASVALRNGLPSGVEGPMRPPAASRATLRTTEGRSAAKQRATRLPKAWPTRCAGPQSIACRTSATSTAKSCKLMSSSEPRLSPVPRMLTEMVCNPPAASTRAKSSK